MERNLRTIIGCSVATAVTVLGLAAAAQASETQEESKRIQSWHSSCAMDLDAIQAVPERRIPAAWADGDADALASLFARDATFIVPGQPYIKSREELRDYMAENFAGPAKGTTVVADVINSKCVASTVAVLVTVGGPVMPGETEPAPDHIGVQTWTIVKRHGTWLVTAYENARDVKLS